MTKKRTPSVVAAIKHAYLVEEKSARMIAKQFCLNPTTVQRALYDAGIMRDRNTAMQVHSRRTQKRNQEIEERLNASR